VVAVERVQIGSPGFLAEHETLLNEPVKGS
jgi:hypothetical protein